MRYINIAQPRFQVLQNSNGCHNTENRRPFIEKSDQKNEYLLKRNISVSVKTIEVDNCTSEATLTNLKKLSSLSLNTDNKFHQRTS